MPNACSANAEGIDHAASHVPTHRFDSHCEELRTAWLESARVGEAVRWASDKFGTGYTVDFEMVRSTKRARDKAEMTGQEACPTGSCACTQ